MKASKIFQIACSFILIFFSLSGYASSRSMEGARRAGTRSSFQAITSNPSLDANRTLLNELLGSDSPQYNWPAFPRTWYQMEKGKNQEVTTTFGGALGNSVVGAGGKVGVNYNYAQKVSLIVVSSLRRNRSPDEENRREVSQQPTDMNELTTFDRRTSRRYFNVDEDYPMVGFCTYEMSLKIGKNVDGTISFLGVTQGLNLAEYQAETIILYSNFFQIDPKVTVEEHMKERCEQHFLQKARPYVESDFEKILLSYFALNHPKNQCELGGPSDENGDESCMLWHDRSFHPTVKGATVPRCERQTDGSSRCVLRSKKNASCPMYIDHKNQFTDVFQLYRKATPSGYAHQCDRGFKCTMDRKPVGLGAFVVWPGAATCK